MGHECHKQLCEKIKERKESHNSGYCVTGYLFVLCKY